MIFPEDMDKSTKIIASIILIGWATFTAFLIWIAISKNVTSFTAIMAPIVALAGIFISYQQYLVRKMEHKFKLFDKRAEVYSLIKKLMKRTTGTAGKFDREEFSKEYEPIDTSRFLFPPNVRKYFNDFYNAAIDLSFYQESYGIGWLHEEDPEYLVEMKNKIDEEFDKVSKMLESIDKVFDKHLSVHK
ncbi:hypothetical protein [Desulfoferula mesophila]|uniref:DUF3137 domain-containing protein n=1 Tax=Desulfoferula mesophila TaxID=3058419 RepID=A0AAU9EKH9_9BACT|nr:hypothetical protein FAK_15670 [Desulfoferula mesophilus]